MLGDFAVSLDLIAALVTVCYIVKLVFLSDSGSLFGNHPFEKRSLLNQHIAQRSL